MVRKLQSVPEASPSCPLFGPQEQKIMEELGERMARVETQHEHLTGLVKEIAENIKEMTKLDRNMEVRQTIILEGITGIKAEHGKLAAEHGGITMTLKELSERVMALETLHSARAGWTKWAWDGAKILLGGIAAWLAAHLIFK